MKNLTIILLMSLSVNLFSQTWKELQKIEPPFNYNNYDENFGSSVALEGTIAVVGSKGFNNNTGKATIYEYKNDKWTKTATLQASDGVKDNYFGCSVDISGEYIVVGAYIANDSTDKKGYIYIYKKPESGWKDMQETAKLTTSGTFDYIKGEEVKISNDNIALLVYGSNKILVYQKPSGSWDNTTKAAELTLSDATIDLGQSIDIDKDVIVTGNRNLDVDKGIAFVFVKQSSQWKDTTETAVLFTSDVTNESNYYGGNTVKIKGNNIVIGSYFSDQDTIIDCGAVYVYEKPQEGWKDTHELTKLIPNEILERTELGKHVEISENYIVVSAQKKRYQNNAHIFNKYSIIFKRTGDHWSNYQEIAKITTSDKNIRFGGTDTYGEMSINDSTIFIGKSSDNDLGTRSGSVYVYQKRTSEWNDHTETQKLLPEPPYYNNKERTFSGSLLNGAIAIDGNTAVVGSSATDNYSGCAYVYQQINDKWMKVATLKPSDGEDDDYFGYSVDIDDSCIVVGSAFNDGNENGFTGAAYIFDRPKSGWKDTTETAKLIASDGEYADYFGQAVCISNNQVAVGARGRGIIYVYQKPESGWINMTETAKLTTSSGEGASELGKYMSCQDSLIASTSGNSVYLFKKPENGWSDNTETKKIEINDSTSVINVCIYNKNILLSSRSNLFLYTYNDDLNFSIDPFVFGTTDSATFYSSPIRLNDKYIVSGVSWDTDQGQTGGAVYIYEKPTGGWINSNESFKIKASDAMERDWFGINLDIQDNKLLVGSWNKYLPEDKNCSGSFYYFKRDTSAITIIDQPSDQENICPGSTVSYKTSAVKAENYQWQVSADNGNSFSNLFDIFPFSGTKTDSMTIEYCDVSMNNYIFRCLLSNTKNNDTTNYASLIMDNVSPVLTTKDITVKLNENGKAIISAYDVIAEMNDNCGISDTTLNKNEFTESDIGDNEIIVTAVDETGNKTQKTTIVTVDQATKIAEHEFNGNISISPNPAHDHIQLSYEKTIDNIEIYTLSGVKILSLNNNYNNINISNLKKGIYIIRARSNNKIFTLKFVKQ